MSHTTMRLFGRDDLLPAAGLAVAMVVVFSTPVARLLDRVRAVEDAHGLQLLPALVILAFVFMAHQLWKRQEMRARTMAADAAAREATDRATDMSRLVALGRDLARSLEPEALRAAALTHLPQLVGGHRLWIAVRRDPSRPSPASGVPSAGRAPASAGPEAGAAPGDTCFPLLAGNEEVGMLGVAAEPPLTPHQRSMLTAAAALLAVSLKNAMLLDNVRQNSVRDALTGCFNRAHALEVFDAELRRARRTQAPLSLVMFDLDDFKSVNDSRGHLCGDAVLASVGARMRAVLRGGDLKCRYGGEEFLVLLADTPLSGACHVAEMLRRDLKEHGMSWHDETLTVTASFGVASLLPDDTDPLTVLARADEALYLAKQQGRNQVCVADLAGVASGGATAAGRRSGTAHRETRDRRP